MSRAITDDTLLTLRDACEVFFGGKVSVATLKAEHGRGNLEMSKIGRSYFTSLAKLKQMEAKCLVAAPVRASGSIRKEAPGLSSTVEAAAAQDSLAMKLDSLKRPLGHTALQSTASRTAQRRLSRTF